MIAGLTPSASALNVCFSAALAEADGNNKDPIKKIRML